MFAPMDLEAEYNNRARVPEHPAIIEGWQRDAAAFEAAVESLKRLAKIADDRLAGTRFLGGENLTFADIMLGGPLYRYFTLDFDRARTPNLEAYYQRLAGREAYARHVMVSYEELRVK